MINESELRKLLGKALLEMFEREYACHGKRFATEEEMQNIRAEPLEYGAMAWNMKAGQLLRHILEKHAEEHQARKYAERRKRDEEGKRALAAAIAEFPAEFGLRAFPGRVFRISKSASYVNDAGELVLYAALKADAYWQDFAKVTPAELRSQVVPLEGK
jgi:hypothetical protein